MESGNKNINSFCPTNTEDWRIWLEKNHVVKDSIWLIIYKKNTPNTNLSWSDAVDEALCFGWIDSVKKSIDAEKYKQYFSKRKPKSIWSRINKDKVAFLIDHGLMQEAGYKSIAIAKENGSWNSLNDIEALIIPEDLKHAFRENEGALDYYDGLSNSIKKQLLYWISSAKRPETRQKRITEIVQNASLGMKPKQFR